MKPETKASAGKAADKVSKPKRTSTAKAKEAPKKPATIPSILLEGDATPAPASGPGQRYALGPSSPDAKRSGPSVETAELPEAYGTKRLLLSARDPRWLYAHWDLTREQLAQYNGLSMDGHLVLRVYRNAVSGQPLSQVHVHPESRNWFVPVEFAGTRYVAELGYYTAKTKWVTISTSGSTLTPPDALSDDTSVRFATLPVDVPFEALLTLVKNAVRESVPLLEALQQLRTSNPALPSVQDISTSRWTPAQEQALAKIVTMDNARRVWMGSLEITEVIRRQLSEELSSAISSQFSLPPGQLGGISSLSSLSSPFGGVAGRQKSFWFNVNAELIIYGATEPDAKVTIGGRQIALRPDGTFSFRFILPDGKYELPVAATSADGDDTRNADLKFSRATEYRGDVKAHPQDPAMKPPRVENVR